MTDNEIKKALEDAIKKDDAPIGECFGCVISKLTAKDALDLINRQQAEVERLNAELNELELEVDRQYEQAEADILGNLPQGGASCHWCIDKHKAYAIKEFAERLKEKGWLCAGVVAWYEIHEIIDNLVKETAGDAE